MPEYGHDIEILLEDDSLLPLALLPEPDGNGGFRTTIAEILAASDGNLPVEQKLHIEQTEDFSGGVGISYNVAPGVYTRTTGWACAAGAATDIGVQSTNGSNSRIVKIESYGGNLYFAQAGDGTANTARVMSSAGGTGALANSLNRGASEYIRDLLVFDDGAGTRSLWASSSNVAPPLAGTNGGLYRFQGAWDTTAPAGTFGAGNGRNALGKAFWVDNEGIGAWRMISISRSNAIAYTDPSSDPLLPASWTEPVRVDTDGGNGLLTLAYARRHIWIAASDGLFDLNELGDTPNLIGSGEQTQLPFTGYAAQYLNGYVYYANGYTINRVNVETNELQEIPGPCGPGWGTPAESKWTGPITSLTVDQGYLVAATLNGAGDAAIWWGIDRQLVGVETPNPLAWYGPEITGSGVGIVTAMKVTALGGQLRIIIASAPLTPATPKIVSVSLPIAGQPISDLIGGGAHRFATGTATSGGWQGTLQVQSLPITTGDTTAIKHLHQHVIGSRALNGLTKMVFHTRADASPGSVAWTTAEDVTVSPIKDFTPDTVVTGHRIEWMMQLVNAASTATGVLDAVRISMFRTMPNFRVRTFTVMAGDALAGSAANMGHDVTYDPDVAWAQLQTLTGNDRTTLRTGGASQKSWTVKFTQVLDSEMEFHEGGAWGRTLTAKVECVVLAGPSLD